MNGRPVSRNGERRTTSEREHWVTDSMRRALGLPTT